MVSVRGSETLEVSYYFFASSRDQGLAECWVSRENRSSNSLFVFHRNKDLALGEHSILILIELDLLLHRRLSSLHAISDPNYLALFEHNQ